MISCMAMNAFGNSCNKLLTIKAWLKQGTYQLNTFYVMGIQYLQKKQLYFQQSFTGCLPNCYTRFKVFARIKLRIPGAFSLPKFCNVQLVSIALYPI